MPPNDGFVPSPSWALMSYAARRSAKICWDRSPVHARKPPRPTLPAPACEITHRGAALTIVERMRGRSIVAGFRSLAPRRA